MNSIELSSDDSSDQSSPYEHGGKRSSLGIVRESSKFSNNNFPKRSDRHERVSRIIDKHKKSQEVA